MRVATKVSSPRNDAPPADRRGRSWIAPLGVLLIGALVGGGIILWQRDARNDAVAAAALDRDLALERVETLVTRVAALRERLEGTDADIREIRRGLRTSEARLDAMIGPPLGDGRHIGALVAVGASQVPPRIVIDVQQWFTGADAVDAALEDGVLPPGEDSIPNDFYLRNDDPRWRVLEVDPAAQVSLSTYPFGDIDDPRSVPFARFADLYDSGEGSLPAFPYWVVVEDRIVVAIEEQYVP